MKCPQCIKQDKKSIVTQYGSSTTAMYIPTQYDEDGNLLPPPFKNITTTGYSCSNGHSWSEKN